MAIAFGSAQPTLILRDIGWRPCEDLLADLLDRSAPRLTFDRGVLEIMSPTREHEQYSTAIARLVSTAAEELGTEFIAQSRSLRSTVWLKSIRQWIEQTRSTGPNM